MKNEILTVTEHNQADKIAAISGISFSKLMKNAGVAVAEEIEAHFSKSKTLVLCGPGNNGGDGYVAAQKLKSNGWDVELCEVIPQNTKTTSNTANEMKKMWKGKTYNLSGVKLEGIELIVDAIFGAGLKKPITGEVANLINKINKTNIPVISIDLPSGINGDTGQILGTAFESDLTVTFFRKKPAHCLLPGLENCGDVIVKDIGTPEEAIDKIKPHILFNSPDLWRDKIIYPKKTDNKYTRGNVVVNCGEMHGAAIFAAEAARRIGAGLTFITCNEDMYNIVCSHTVGSIVKKIVSDKNYDELLLDERKNVFVLGPGQGKTKLTRDRVIKTLKAGKKCVVDADAISVFENNPVELFKHINSDCIITPHMGEFKRIFEYSSEKSKVDLAISAAKKSGATVLIKGYDTVIASKDGRVVINTNSSPLLATGGTGDILSGMISGLMAQGMTSFDAACVSVYLQGEIAKDMPQGFVAEDLLYGLYIAY